VGLMMTRPLSE
jgi:hypothetical protein